MCGRMQKFRKHKNKSWIKISQVCHSWLKDVWQKRETTQSVNNANVLIKWTTQVGVCQQASVQCLCEWVYETNTAGCIDSRALPMEVSGSPCPDARGAPFGKSWGDGI